MSDIGIITCLDLSLETECIQAFKSISGLSVQRRCADLVEVISAAEAGLGQICALDSEIAQLDRDDVSRLQKAGVLVVVVNCDSDLGADATSAPNLSELVAVLSRLAAQFEKQPLPSPAPQQGGTGKILAVTSPPGATGRSSIAIALARHLSQVGQLTLLVDADINAPSLEQMLGVSATGSGLAGAAHLASADRLDADALRQMVLSTEGGFGLLSGLSVSGRWREIGSSSLEVVWQRCRQIASWTVIDTAAMTDLAGRELAYGPHRDDVTCSALEAADYHIYVGEGGPLGILRLIQNAPNIPENAFVVVNKVGYSNCGPRPERAVREVLASHCPTLDPILLRFDEEVAGKAIFEGTAWQDIPGENLAAGLDPIFRKLNLPVAAPPRRRRKLVRH